MISNTLFKLSSAFILFSIGVFGGLLPIIFKKGKFDDERKKYKSAANCGAAGVLFATGMCHMLPEGASELADIWGDHFPFGHMFCGLGLLTLLVIDHASVFMAKGDKKASYQVIPKESDFESLAGTEEEPLSPIDILSPVAHNHNHGFHGEAKVDGRGILILLSGLCLHSLMEGLGIGATATNLWGAVIAIVAHKGLIGYALGSFLSNSKPIFEHILIICAFASFSPIGILIGLIMTDSSDGVQSPASSACVALTAGTFLYVSLMELLPTELSNPFHMKVKLMAVLIGFVSAVVLGAAAG